MEACAGPRASIARSLAAGALGAASWQAPSCLLRSALCSRSASRGAGGDQAMMTTPMTAASTAAARAEGTA